MTGSNLGKPPTGAVQCRHLVIHGKVQGVAYRAHMKHEAGRAGVRGWVRNRTDGAVEAKVWGGADEVRALLEWCRRGPSASRVVRVDIAEVTGTDPGPAEFSILPDSFV